MAEADPLFLANQMELGQMYFDGLVVLVPPWRCILFGDPPHEPEDRDLSFKAQCSLEMGGKISTRTEGIRVLYKERSITLIELLDGKRESGRFELKLCPDSLGAPKQ